MGVDFSFSFFFPPEQQKVCCFSGVTGLRFCMFLAEEQTGEEVGTGAAACQGGFGGVEES